MKIVPVKSKIFFIELETTMLSDLVANHHDHVGNT